MKDKALQTTMATKSNSLTIKQQVFVAKTVELLSPTKAARIAYPENKTPKDIAKKNMKKPHIKRAIDELMQYENLTPYSAAKRLAQIIMKPEQSDAVSVAAINTAAKWAGW